MLKLTKIEKDYKVGDGVVRALKGVDLCFRENEFVSILGPSGCGKTTMLNLVGGLDRATGGDLAIFGRSTKDFKDRDWDVYRNHRIGFIFQSYNLIPHQTVLGNVELALTIAGMSKEERVAKAKAALDKVGLSDKYYKRPNQLSGGQCQRVAIARALVNDPEILLADEPTGALDSTTSAQIMQLIKEIARERLVIMVTHNPELAQAYSTRIIRLLDGNLVADSNPFTEEEEKAATSAALVRRAEQERAELAELAVLDPKKAKRKKEKAKMSFWTAFKLSMQNLLTKKRRTTMTAVASSIGIIGVSLVLSISIGLQGFINNMQNDMLAGNPITISQTGFDLSALQNMSAREQKEILDEGNWVNVNEMIAEMNERLSSMENIRVTNSMTQDYITYLSDMPQEYWSALHYNYGLDAVNTIYTPFDNGNPTHQNRVSSLGGIKEMYGSVLGKIPGFEAYAEYVNMLDNSFSQASDTRNPATKAYLESQYNVLWYGNDSTDGIAQEADEVMIVLSGNRALDDLTLGQIGYYSQPEFVNMVNRAVGNGDNGLYDGGQIAYDKLASQTFIWYPNNTIFNPQNPDSSIPFTYSPYAGSDAKWQAGSLEQGLPGLELKIVGIIEPKDGLNYGMLESGLYYTTALAEYAIEKNHNSDLAQFLRNESIGKTEIADSLSGTAYLMRKGTVVEPSNPLFQLTGGTGIIPMDWVQVVDGKVITFEYDYWWDGAAHTEALGIVDGGSNMMSTLTSMMGAVSGVTMVSYSIADMGGSIEALTVKDVDGNITAIDPVLTDGKTFALPTSIALYPPNFQQKDKVLAWLDAWNGEETITLSNGLFANGTDSLTADMREKITYSDLMGMIMGMMGNLIDMVTIALIGFTSLALLVSCVMIALITYVSVVERIKEIGVIRSLGGRKRDVSNLFTAETFIIGLAAGLIGVLATYLFSWIINLAVGAAGIAAIASFPIGVAAVMVGVSVGLTLISGLAPSRSAAKKDPVVALRTE